MRYTVTAGTDNRTRDVFQLFPPAEAGCALVWDTGRGAVRCCPTPLTREDPIDSGNFTVLSCVTSCEESDWRERASERGRGRERGRCRPSRKIREGKREGENGWRREAEVPPPGFCVFHVAVGSGPIQAEGIPPDGTGILLGGAQRAMTASSQLIAVCLCSWRSSPLSPTLAVRVRRRSHWEHAVPRPCCALLGGAFTGIFAVRSSKRI